MCERTFRANRNQPIQNSNEENSRSLSARICCMNTTPRYYIVRLLDDNSEECFLLSGEEVEESARAADAVARMQMGMDWIERHPSEIDRFAMALREMSAPIATLLQQQHPELAQIELDQIRELLLENDLRRAVATRLAPSLVASLWPGAGPLQIRSLWRQALSGKGRYAQLLAAIVCLHHRFLARIISQALKLARQPSWPVEESSISTVPIPLRLFPAPSRYLQVMNCLPYHALREVLSFGRFTASEDSPWPTAPLNKGGAIGHAQLFPVELELDPFQETNEQEGLARSMWNQVSELSDLDADVLDMLSALWLDQARSPNDPARISVKQLLKLRGLKTKRGEAGRSSGYRPDQRQQLFRSLSHISNLYLLVRGADLSGGEPSRGRSQREVRSRAFIITDIAGKRTGSTVLEIEEFLIRPGVLFGQFLFGNGRQIALLSLRAIQYDRIRQDWEKRLARYFSWQWRNDAQNQRSLRRFTVKTLLDSIGKQIDPERPLRTRKRLEKALNQLAEDEVIHQWHWVHEHPGTGNGGPDWLQWRVIVEAPEPVRKQYQFLLDGSSSPPEKRQERRPSALPPPIPDWAVQLVTYRKTRGLNQAQLAAQLQITQSYLSLLERGARRPNPELAQRIEDLEATEGRKNEV